MARPKTLSRRILVNIRRDMTEITPRAIWEHEMPLLQELHGEDDVKLVDPKTLDEGYSGKPRADMLIYNKTMDTPAKPSTTMGLGYVFIGNPEVEYQRLADVYGRHPEVNILLVEKIYGRQAEKRLAALLGSPELDDLPEAQLRGLILEYGYAPEPHHQAPLEEKQAVWDMRAALNVMPHADLVKLASGLGVQIG